MTKPLDPIEPLSATQAAPPSAAAPAPGTACANCGTALVGEYCHACGQFAHNPLASLRHAIEDVFESFWHLDGRIFRTLRDLLVPGRVARNYLAGQRVRYIPPLRLFVILSLLTFFIAHFAVPAGSVNLDNDAIGSASTVAEVEAARERELARIEDRIRAAKGSEAQAGVRAGLAAAQASIRSTAATRIQQLREAQAKGLPPPDPMRDGFTFNGKPWDPVTNRVSVQGLPGFANDWINDAIGRGIGNLKRYARDQGALKDAWLSAVPTSLFFLMPVFALLLRVAYAFTPWRYLEHLVVALYSHAFLLLGLLVILLLVLATRGTALGSAGETATTLLAFATVGYLLLMQKRVYRQGWPLTLLKFGVLGLVYSVLLGIGALLALGAVFVR